jgi:hypothetical protein
LNQKEIEVAALAMRIFLVELALSFDANFHELEEITRRALGAVESEVVLICCLLLQLWEALL